MNLPQRAGGTPWTTEMFFSCVSSRETLLQIDTPASKHLLPVTAARWQLKRASRQLSSDKIPSLSASQTRDGPSTGRRKIIHLPREEDEVRRESSHICCTDILFTVSTGTRQKCEGENKRQCNSVNRFAEAQFFFLSFFFNNLLAPS